MPFLVTVAALLVAARGGEIKQATTRERSAAIVTAVHRSGVVATCWNAYLRSHTDAPSVRVHLRLEVDGRGAVGGVTVVDPAPADLVRCVRAGVQALSFGPGAALTVETTYGFATGVSAPVPAPSRKVASEVTATPQRRAATEAQAPRRR